MYFVLVSSPFYNIASKAVHEKLLKIISLGHVIGLHLMKRIILKNIIINVEGSEAVNKQ